MAETTLQGKYEAGRENSYLLAGCHFIGHREGSEKGNRLLRLSDPSKRGAPQEAKAQEGLLQGKFAYQCILYICVCRSPVEFFLLFSIYVICRHLQMITDTNNTI